MDELTWANDLFSVATLVSSLGENARSLFTQACSLEGGLALLRLLNGKPNALLTAEDYAYYLHQAAATVERNLKRLVELGWARQVDTHDCSWFGLTSDSHRRRVIAELCNWQDGWNERLDKIKVSINGAARA